MAEVGHPRQEGALKDALCAVWPPSAIPCVGISRNLSAMWGNVFLLGTTSPTPWGGKGLPVLQGDFPHVPLPLCFAAEPHPAFLSHDTEYYKLLCCLFLAQYRRSW